MSIANADATTATSADSACLMEFVLATRYHDLPDAVVHETKRCVLDFLGVTLGGSTADAATMTRETVRELGGNPDASCLGTPLRTSVLNAALANGVAAHVLDFDDTHIPTILHATSPILSAGFPVAEWQGRTGKELIAAHALAFELSARVSLAMYPEHYDAGWHMTGTTGTLAAATSAALLLKLDAVQFANAIGAAATQAAGHREQFGAMTKSLHAGKAASNGVLAALLARRGFAAAADSLEGRRGLFHVMSTRSDPGALTDGLGERWEIQRNGFKPYACGVVTHPAIDAARALRARGVLAEDVERIDLRVHPLVLELTGISNPQTGLEGKFSIGFAIAIALIDGAARQRQFTDENVRRDDVIALRERIFATADPTLSHTEAVARACVRGGAIWEERVTAATGTPENPISDDELRAKFLDLAEPVVGAPRAQKLADLVNNLENRPSIVELVAALTPTI